MTESAIAALIMMLATFGAIVYAWLSVRHAKKHPSLYEKNMYARLEHGRETNAEYDSDSVDPVLANSDV